MGLSICARLTEMMGGKIAVESKLGVGSEFTVTLPYRYAKDEPPTTDIQDLRGLKILVAARSVETQEVLRCYLRFGGAEVEVVESLEESQKRSEAAARAGQEFDIVVLSGEWEKKHKNELREWFRDHQVLTQMRFVVVLTDRAEGATRLDYPDSVLVRSNPMRRSAFLKGVAFAAGRASPDVEMEAELPSLREREVPRLEEAEARGELVLVAEDNRINQEVILRQLNLLGYAAEVAGDGQEALELWGQKKYGLLLTDCHMPEMDGFALTRAIREAEQEKERRFPIVAITANALKGEADRCLEAGMDDYLAKPVRLSELKQVLSRRLPLRGGDDAQAESAPEARLEEPKARTLKDSVGSVADSPIDPSVLAELVGDNPAEHRALLKKLVGQARDIIQEIHEACANRSGADIHSLAHKLKGSAMAEGANELADVCQALETAGKLEDWKSIDTLEPRLDALVTSIKKYVDAL